MSHGFIVAIDGTAGSGKSTTARLAARELGFLHLDTGAMYRAITLKAIRQGLDLAKLDAVRAMLDATQVDFRPVAGAHHVFLDGEDVAQAIRAPEVDKLVSHVAVIAIVREKLVAEQRRIAEGREVVCEGRDITSVVFPHAELKIYMDADLTARGGRRRHELKGKGVAIADDTVRENLTERDYIDSNRAHSPLTRVPDAVLLDTTNLTVPEEVAIVVTLARMRRARHNAGN